MGSRAQVKVINDEGKGVILYTHWGSHELPQTVARALERGRPRWGNTGYLTRIVFSQMVHEIGGSAGLLDETGFGIEPLEYEHGDLDYPPIVVNDASGTVTHGGLQSTYEEFIAMQLSGAARQR